MKYVIYGGGEVGNFTHNINKNLNKNFKTTLGVQCLLMPENIEQLPAMANELKNIGVDYLTIKPYSQHKHSKNKKIIDYELMLDLERELKNYETENFAVYFRANAMKKMRREKNYKICHGLLFMTHIDAAGNIWPCVAHIGATEFLYGNIYENTFEEIWNGKRRKEVIKKMNDMDINKLCRDACRLDEINQYLDKLKHPEKLANFIF